MWRMRSRPRAAGPTPRALRAAAESPPSPKTGRPSSDSNAVPHETASQSQRRGALRNRRFAFTNKLALVSELLQNARHASATHVVIERDAATSA